MIAKVRMTVKMKTDLFIWNMMTTGLRKRKVELVKVSMSINAGMY